MKRRLALSMIILILGVHAQILLGLIDVGATSAPVKREGSFTSCDESPVTLQIGYRIDGGQLDQAEWSIHRPMTSEELSESFAGGQFVPALEVAGPKIYSKSYHVTGTCRVGEYVKLDVDCKELGRSISSMMEEKYTLKIHGRVKYKGLGMEHDSVEDSESESKSSSLSKEIGLTVPDNAERVDLHISYETAWMPEDIPLMISDKIAVRVSLDVIDGGKAGTGEIPTMTSGETNTDDYGCKESKKSPIGPIVAGLVSALVAGAIATPFAIKKHNLKKAGVEVDTSGEGGDVAVDAEPVYVEPETMVVTVSPGGAQELLIRDAETGEWFTREGNHFDLEGHKQNFPEQVKQYEEMRQRNEELEKAKQTAMHKELDRIKAAEEAALREIQKEIDARRREQLALDQEWALTQAEQAHRLNNWGRIFGDTVIRAGVEVAETSKDAAIAVKDAVVYTGEALGTAVGTVVYDPKQAWEEVANAAKYAKDTIVDTATKAKDAVVDKVEEIIEKPWIVVEGVMDTGKAIYDTVTDPKKLLEIAKSFTGITDFEKSWDCNTPLAQRIKHTLIGSFKMASTIITAQRAVGAIRGAGKGAGATAVKPKPDLPPPARAGTKPIPQPAPRRPSADYTKVASAETFRKAQKQGTKRVDDFVKALKTKDKRLINEAALNLQSDSMAIAEINRRSNFVKNQFNKTMADTYGKVDKNVIARLAKEHNVKPKDISVVSATNPSRSIRNIKVGDDRDFTMRILGRDVPEGTLQKIYNEEFKKITNFDAGALRQQAVDRMSAEAYGRAPSDLKKALGGEAHKIADTQQMSKTISYKSQESARRAAEAIQAGDFITAEVEMYDAMRQAAKQWNNQIGPAIKKISRQPGKLGKVKVPIRLEKAMGIVDQIHVGVSPAEITQQLAEIGFTPDEVFTQAGEILEAAVKFSK